MRARIYAVYYFYLVLIVVIVIRLFYWQVISFDRLKSLAEQQTLTSLSIPAARGTIFSADGSPLVINQRAFLIFAEPYHVKEPQKILSLMQADLGVDPASFSAQLSNKELKWLPILHRIEEAKLKNLKAAKFEGLGFLEEPKRFYPESSMAAHLLGFVGMNAKGLDQGYFGIEGYYDEQLRGRNGVQRQESDALGHPILAGRMVDIPAEDGRDLTLTIDKTIQYIAEDKLKKGIEKYEAKGGTVVIMDPATGAVMAMAAFPSYDPGIFQMFPAEYYKNPVISSAYEPGSTFKTLVMAAGINDKKITPSTEFDEDGPLEIAGYKIQTWNQKYNGRITMSDVLTHSSNVGMVFVQRKIGGQRLLDYISVLGFGELTDIDLQDESTPAIRQRDSWSEIDYATASFGQGIAVTPLQMVRAVSAIANGGKLMRPYVVKSIQPEAGSTIVTKPRLDKEVFSNSTAQQLKEMMVNAVDNGETKRLKPPGYRVAGKTGTAQIPIAGHYDASKTIASFIGFAPVDNPRFVMLVTVVEPTTSQWGSETAAPIFFTIARDIFMYLGLPSSS